jgi:hypothetical protein
MDPKIRACRLLGKRNVSAMEIQNAAHAHLAPIRFLRDVWSLSWVRKSNRFLQIGRICVENVTLKIFRRSAVSRSTAIMRVILAQPRGFCAGVVRAIDIVERALEKNGQPVFVRHEIVHNQHVVESLKKKGARFVEELDEVPDGAVTVFSAHGVPQSVVLEARSRQLPVIDATCPLVSKVHSQAKHYVAQGRALILIGHPGHPEVEGTMGQAGAPVHLVSSRQQVDTLDLSPDTPVA